MSKGKDFRPRKRGFDDDGLTVGAGIEKKTFEELIGRVFRPHGPLIAIGRPGEAIPLRGPSFSDEAAPLKLTVSGGAPKLGEADKAAIGAALERQARLPTSV